jgi:hypothetical protein
VAYDAQMKKLFVLATVLFIGCGDDGVSDSKKLSDLSTAEATDLCKELASDHPPRTVTCGNFMFTLGIDPATCDGEVPTAACTATAGDARACQDAYDDLTDEQICTNETGPAACQKLTGCEGE